MFESLWLIQVHVTPQPNQITALIKRINYSQDNREYELHSDSLV